MRFSAVVGENSTVDLDAVEAEIQRRGGYNIAQRAAAGQILFDATEDDAALMLDISGVASIGCVGGADDNHEGPCGRGVSYYGNTLQ